MKSPTKRLGDVVEILSGFAFDSASFNDAEGMKLIRIRDVVRGSSETYYNGPFDKKYIVHKGDLLIGMDGEFKAALWRDEPSLLNQRVCKIQADERYLFQSYLRHFLPNVLKKIEDATPFVTVKHLSVKTLNEIQIQLQPLAEQQRIAALLDTADNLVRLREAAIEKLDQLAQSVFVELIENQNKAENFRKLGDICDVRDGTHDSPKYVTDGFPLVTSKNLSNGFVDLSDVNYISRDDFNEINKRSKVDCGDILMPMIGTIGNPVIVQEKNPQFAIKNVALIKRKKESPNPIYIKSVLSSAFFDRYVSKISRGGTQKFLGLGDIRKFPIPILEKEQEEKYIAIQSKTDELRRKLTNDLDVHRKLTLTLQAKSFAVN